MGKNASVRPCPIRYGEQPAAWLSPPDLSPVKLFPSRRRILSLANSPSAGDIDPEPRGSEAFEAVTGAEPPYSEIAVANF